jgi:hypothetical protein
MKLDKYKITNKDNVITITFGHYYKHWEVEKTRPKMG